MLAAPSHGQAAIGGDCAKRSAAAQRLAVAKMMPKMTS